MGGPTNGIGGKLEKIPAYTLLIV